MAIVPWIIISIVVLIFLGLIMSLVLIKNKDKKQKTNYYSLFVMGAIWVPFGLIMSYLEKESMIGGLFFILGWIYFVIGILHKDEWDKNKGPYLIQNKKIRLFVMIGLILLLILGVIAFFLIR